jgi:alpha-beta hydrolase superfamily lysophospholipase
MAARIVALVAPALTVPNGLSGDDLARGVEVPRDYREDPLVHDRVSVGLVRDIWKAGRAWEAGGREVPVPVLLMHGSCDAITSYAASKSLAERFRSSIDWHGWPGAYHELHHDTVQNDVMTCVVSWLERRVR